MLQGGQKCLGNLPGCRENEYRWTNMAHAQLKKKRGTISFYVSWTSGRLISILWYVVFTKMDIFIYEGYKKTL